MPKYKHKHIQNIEPNEYKKIIERRLLQSYCLFLNPIF